MPSISIIVAVYNLEEYLPKCIDSILAQTFNDFELILINDGSTDSCLNICNEYASKDSRIIVIDQQNQGLSEVRNLGIREAKGKYIGFVDGDDWIEPTMYETLYNLCIDHEAEISSCLYNVIDNNEIINIKENTKEIKIFTSREAIKYTYERNFSGFLVWNKLFKKEVFENILFPKDRLFEDAAVLYKTFHKANRIVLIKSPLYNYLINRATGITKTQLNTFSDKRFQIVLNYNETFDFIAAEYPDLCELITLDYFQSLRMMVVDLIQEQNLRSNIKYIWKVSKQTRRIVGRILKNSLISMKHKIIALLIAWVPIPGIYIYKLRISNR